MAKRPQYVHRAVTRRGDEYGVAPHEADAERLAALARWYCLTVHHLARIEAARAGETRDVASITRGISRRLTKLSKIATASSNAGPMVGSAIIHEKATGWWCTGYGATFAGLPWRLPPEINYLSARHAWLAADIGIALETRGYRVVTQRELGSGITVTSHRLDGWNFKSPFTTPGGQTVTKDPDVAVLGDRGRFIAIEVERQSSRPLRTYLEKLTAYRDNTDVAAVWYVCATPAIANRVGAAANRVFSDGRGGFINYPLRVRVANPVNPDVITDLDTHDGLQADLVGLGTPQLGAHP